MASGVYFIEKNVHGAWVIYGELGVKQYYGYTKSEARAKYMSECNARLFYAKR